VAAAVKVSYPAVGTPSGMTSVVIMIIQAILAHTGVAAHIQIIFSLEPFFLPMA